MANSANNRYQGLDPDLAKELISYEHSYFKEDRPIPFCGLNIYPVTMHEYEKFFMCVDCFTLDKNETPQGIRMTNLDYLISKTIEHSDSGNEWAYKFNTLLEMIFHIQNGVKCGKCGEIIPYNSQHFKDYLLQIQKLQSDTNMLDKIKKHEMEIPKLLCPKCNEAVKDGVIETKLDEKSKHYMLIVDGHIISGKDFNRLRRIVLFQNMPDYFDDSWVDKGLREDRKAKMALEQKKNENLEASTERKIVCLSIATNYKFEEIYNMTIRKFTIALSAVEDLINYKIMKSAAMNGFVQLPKDQKIEHWIYKKTGDIYGDMYKDAADVRSSINNL